MSIIDGDDPNPFADPFDDREPFYEHQGRMELRGFHNVDSMLLRAHTALAVLCLVRGFDWEDAALIALVAHADRRYADALIDKLEEETGIRFWLSSDQWGTLYMDLKGTLP